MKTWLRNFDLGLYSALTLALFASNSYAYSGTILFAGSEDVDFTRTGYVEQQGSDVNTRNRYTYSRGAMKIGYWSSTSDPPVDYLSTPAFSAQSTVWVHGYLGSEVGYATTLNAQLVRVLDGSTSRIAVRGTGTSGQLKISKRNAAGTFTDLVTTAAGALQAGVTYPAVIDLHVNYSTTGSVTLYINGVSAATYSGDVTTDSATTLSQVTIGTYNTSNYTQWSEVIVGTADTRSLSLWTIPPVASGTTQQFLPDTVGNINPFTINDTNLTATSTNDHLSGWTTSTTPPTGQWGLVAIVQSTRVARGGTGPQAFAFYCRSGGTDNVSADQTGISTSFTNYSAYIWATNCTTAAAWAIGDITTGFNLGIKARP